MARKRARRRAGIAAPELPATPTLRPTAAARLADGAAFSQALLSGLDFSGQAANDLLVEQSVLRETALGQTRLRQSQAIDARFDGCDLVNADWEKIHLQRVEFAGSRLGGLRLAEAQIENVLFQGCQLDFAIFWAARLRHVRFEDCRLSEASFEGARLEAVVFRNCDLSGVDLREASLQDVDLRGSVLRGVQIGLKDLKGAIVEPQQAIELATLLGIVVRPLDADEGEG